MKCPKCEVTIVPKKDMSLTCKLCDSVWHKDCISGLDEETFQVLKKNEKKDRINLYWYCTKQCDRAASKFLSGMAHLEEEVRKTNERIDIVEKNVTAIQSGRFSEKMTETVKDIAQEIVEHNGSVRPNIEDVTAKVAQVQEILDTEKREQFAEMDDRLRRRTNLLIFRLPEEKNTDEAKAEDVSKVGQILKE